MGRGVQAWYSGTAVVQSRGVQEYYSCSGVIVQGYMRGTVLQRSRIRSGVQVYRSSTGEQGCRSSIGLQGTIIVHVCMGRGMLKVYNVYRSSTGVQWYYNGTQVQEY
jgi:hypothetical protein